MSNPITIRPFSYTPEDYAAIIRIWNVAWPNLAGFQDQIAQDDARRNPSLPLTRRVVEVPSGVIAYGDVRKLSQAEDAGSYYLSLQVLLGWRCQGIGTALYEHLLGLLAGSDARTLLTDTYASFAGSLQFLQARGFEEFMRYPLSVLDIDLFDFDRFARLQTRMEQHSIRIVPLAELQKIDPQWKEKFWKLDTQINLDAPAPVTPRALSLEEFIKKKINSHWLDPQLWWIAVQGENWVGESALERVSPERYWTNITGVLKSHRRGGIATALKAACIRQAQARGAKTIQTSNEENNPMYGINLLLGFQPDQTEVHYRKVLPAADQA